MKTLISMTVFVLATENASLAQGLVNFYNDLSTPVYAQALTYGGSISIMSGERDSFYFGLFVGDPQFGNWTFTGVYGTNTGVNGLFSGGTVAVPGWSPGTTTNFIVAGWSKEYAGHDYNMFFHGGDFGMVGGSGTAGNGSTIPALNLFNGGPGTIQPGGGFLLVNSFVPEPSSTVLLGLAAGVSLIYRKSESPKAKGSSPS